MKRKWLPAVLLLAALALILTGCVPGDGSYTASNPAGFLSGIWHGWIAPVTLIAGIFKGSIRIYETVNSGWWYDFGFYMAIISGFGGLSLTRRKFRHRNDDD